LLIVSHLSIGNVSMAEGHAPLNILKPHEVTSDNLFTAIQRLVNSGTWFLVFVVAIMSGLWPYVKIFGTLLIVLLADRQIVSPRMAQTTLGHLETFGKWSFADIVLLSINCACFDIETPSYNMPIGGDLKVVIYMSVRFGALGLMLAIIFSMILTTWAKSELEIHEPASEPLVAIDPLLPKKWALRGVCSGFVASVLVVVGSCVPVIHVVRTGFLANIMDEKDRESDLSLMGIALSMDAHPSPTALALSIIAFSVAFVAPLCEALFLTAGCAASLRDRPANVASAVTLAEWCSSFDTLDVFLIVSVVQIFEIEKAVHFNIGPECKNFKGLMNNEALLGVAGLGDAVASECFGISTSLAVGFWILLAAVLFRTIAWRHALRLPREGGSATALSAPDAGQLKA